MITQRGKCDWCEQSFELATRDYTGMFTLCNGCRIKQAKK